MSAANHVMKSLVLMAMLIGVLAVVWELPRWEKQAIERQNIPKALPSELPQFDTKTFLRHIKTRLPRYQTRFQSVSQDHRIPWTLLAAQAYQESRWNRNAMSPTGVRGLMMLTRETASDLGIANRLDPHKSILGGARYLAELYERIPQEVKDPDRMYFALAAYNVGLGHVKDARLLAKRLHKNPNRWRDIKRVLPLLAKKKYYQTLPNRYARGWEPVQYVKRIRAYRKILEHVLDEKSRQASEL